MAILKTNIHEEITLHGNTHHYVTEKEISEITEIYHRITTIPAGVDTTIFSLHNTITTGDDGTIDLDEVKYMRITNLHSSVSVILNLQVESGEADGAADGNVAIALEAGKSFMLHQPHDGIATVDDSLTAITDLKDLESIVVDSSSTAVTIEILMGIS